MKLLIVLFVIQNIDKIVALINCALEPSAPDAILRKKLLCGQYDSSERPVKKFTDPVVVSMHMVLQNFDIEDDRQKLFINVWIRLSWQDQFLVWDPREHTGIKDLMVDSKDIWLPDMMPYSAYYSNNLDATCTSPKCSVLFNGEVRCIPACDYHSLCYTDFTNWPFDRMNCTIRFGMWAEYANEVDFTADGMSFISNQTNSHNQWIITATNVSKHTDPSDINGTTIYPSVVYNFILERHSGVHCAIILTPAFVMISLNLVSLWINCCFVERLIMLSVSVFIHFLFIVNMYWQVPYSGSTVPVFMIFFRDSLIITASLLISTVFIKHLYLSAKPIPAVLGSTVTVLTGNSLGKWFFNLETTADPEDETMEENRPNEESPNETTRDTAILVGEQPTESVEKPSKLDDKTRVFAKVLDRLLFIVGFVSYTLMIITLIPRN
ncbi:neuronal acetylcholine receptor subunit alpha-2-like [Aedes albopictus]|uniref:Neurotransmitter-gated ion-channel ligand-binding domain-containing protein n=1 Tax=Aedes albopictus TaxID=7160 RepID=A0ABM1YAH2_AEDAL